MSNITNNRINTVIPDPDLIAAKQHIQDVGTLLPFLIGLEYEEKKGMVGINLTNKQFVEDCLNEMNLEPGLMPSFIDPSHVKADYQLYLQTDQLILATQDLLDKLRDTQFLAGAEAYSVCLIYYRIAEAAAKAGLPGADERYNRLKERFKDQGTPNTPEPPTPDTPSV